MPLQSDARIPVIVGVGEVMDRPADATLGLEPLRLMEQAALRAQADAGATLLADVDSVDIVCELSWPYADAPGRLAQLLGMTPVRAHYGPIGGETPVRFVHEAALRIAAGESHIGLVVGAEAEYTVGMARKSGVTLPWEAKDTETKLLRGKDFLHPIAVAHGIATPATVYPLIENAAQAEWQQTPAQGTKQNAELWARYAAVAVDNPYSWLPRAWSADEILTADANNRYIAWPYTKHMVANPMVNQGAAVIVTSLARALAAGIAKDRIVHIHGGAAANEPRDFLDRAHLNRSHAQDVVLEAAMQLAPLGKFAAAELYSCFPIVPKLAQRTLQDADLVPTVTGGLSFFGAPLNNYMTHAVAAMVKTLRQQQGEAYGLVYGQGEYLTKHHAIVLSSATARPAAVLDPDYRFQAQADARQPVPPPLLDAYSGPATLETYTLIYGRDGLPSYGTILGRTPTGERVVARVPERDRAGIDMLRNPLEHPIGRTGEIALGEQGLYEWCFN